MTVRYPIFALTLAKTFSPTFLMRRETFLTITKRYVTELEGNGPIDSRAKVMSDSKLGLKFEIRILNYPGNHAHVAETLFLISSNGKQTAEGKLTADIKINY